MSDVVAISGSPGRSAGSVNIERTGGTVADHSIRGLREEAERQGRGRLGPDRWARAYAAGRTASIDSLLKDIETAAT